MARRGQLWLLFFSSSQTLSLTFSGMRLRNEDTYVCNGHSSGQRHVCPVTGQFSDRFWGLKGKWRCRRDEQRNANANGIVMAVLETVCIQPVFSTRGFS
jgi:hypothetical protein